MRLSLIQTTLKNIDDEQRNDNSLFKSRLNKNGNNGRPGDSRNNIAKAIKENPQMEELKVVIQTLEKLDKEDKKK